MEPSCNKMDDDDLMENQKIKRYLHLCGSDNKSGSSSWISGSSSWRVHIYNIRSLASWRVDFGVRYIGKSTKWLDHSHAHTRRLDCKTKGHNRVVRRPKSNHTACYLLTWTLRNRGTAVVCISRGGLLLTQTSFNVYSCPLESQPKNLQL